MDLWRNWKLPYHFFDVWSIVYTWWNYQFSRSLYETKKNFNTPNNLEMCISLKNARSTNHVVNKTRTRYPSVYFLLGISSHFLVLVQTPARDICSLFCYRKSWCLNIKVMTCINCASRSLSSSEKNCTSRNPCTEGSHHTIILWLLQKLKVYCLNRQLYWWVRIRCHMSVLALGAIHFNMIYQSGLKDKNVNAMSRFSFEQKENLFK